MFRYDPHVGPKKDMWLALDERERIVAVSAYHRKSGASSERPELHSAMHAAVETQLALGEVSALRALDRLLLDGLDRHDAVHAIASVLVMHLHELVQGTIPAVDAGSRYNAELDKLTAKSWRESFASMKGRGSN